MEGLRVRRPTLVGLWSFQFLTFMRRGVFYSFMYIYLFSLLGNVTTTAALGTLTMLMSAAGQNFLWGRISDRYRLRAKLIVIGEVVAAFAYVLVFIAHKSLIDSGSNFAAGLSLIIGLAVLEFFWSMSDVGWAALVTDITTVETRGGFVGAVSFVQSVGRMTGIIMAGSLYAGGLGFRHGTIFYIVTVMLLAGAVIMWFVSRSFKTSTAPAFLSSTLIEENHTADDTATKAQFSSDNERTFLWFLIALTIVVLGAASINQIFPLFLELKDGLNAGDLEVSFILSAWTLGGMVASLAAGRLADRVDRRAVILSGLVIAVATPLFYGLASNVAVMAFVYGVNGLSFMTLQTAGFALAGDIIPEHKRGRLLSRYNAVMALSWGPAGLLIGGPIADVQTRVFGVLAHAAYINAFLTSSALIFIGAVVFFTKVRRRMRKEE